MNDREEITTGREALMRSIERHEPPLEQWQVSQLGMFGVTDSGRPHEVFLLCAAQRGDALTLWRSYGAGSEAEYSIGSSGGHIDTRCVAIEGRRTRFFA